MAQGGIRYQGNEKWLNQILMMIVSIKYWREKEMLELSSTKDVRKDWEKTEMISTCRNRTLWKLTESIISKWEMNVEENCRGNEKWMRSAEQNTAERYVAKSNLREKWSDWIKYVLGSDWLKECQRNEKWLNQTPVAREVTESDTEEMKSDWEGECNRNEKWLNELLL